MMFRAALDDSFEAIQGAVMPIRMKRRDTWPYEPRMAETEGIVVGAAPAMTACYAVRNRKPASYADPPKHC